MEIRKKCWPEFFSKIMSGKKSAEIRLADFECNEGDTLILEEWDPKTKQYTGRKIKKNIKSLAKVDMTRFHTIEEIKKHGFYLIELE